MKIKRLNGQEIVIEATDGELRDLAASLAVSSCGDVPTARLRSAQFAWLRALVVSEIGLGRIDPEAKS